MRVLVAEDERVMADTIAEGLRRRAMAVDVCYDGDAALERVTVHRYDVVVLDRDLPQVHGDEVCRAIVAAGGGDPGADADRGGRDPGPGGRAGPGRGRLPDQAVRVRRAGRAGGRRSAAGRGPRCRRCWNAPGSGWTGRGTSAWRDGLLLSLSPKEFAVLEVLMRAEGSVVSAEELLEKAWDENADPFTNAVRVAVMTLRRKLGDPPVIQTVPGAGYRLGCELTGPRGPSLRSTARRVTMAQL